MVLVNPEPGQIVETRSYSNKSTQVVRMHTAGERTTLEIDTSVDEYEREEVQVTPPRVSRMDDALKQISRDIQRAAKYSPAR